MSSESADQKLNIETAVIIKPEKLTSVSKSGRDRAG
jgi:hypothetical protein